jgi:hypothetical protein
MPLDLNGNKLNSTSIGPRGEIIKQIVTDNLILHLDAGNKNSYSGSGTVWTDLSGNGYNGTLTNGPTYSSGNGGTIQFDGTNDYVSVDVNSFIRSRSTVYTFSTFFYLTTSNGGAPFCLMTLPNDNNNNDGFWQHLNLGNWLWRTEDNVSGEFGGNVEAPSTFANATWYHLTVIVRTNSVSFYRNANLVSTISTTFAWANMRSDNTPYLLIGAGYGLDYYLTGNIANFLMYDKELSASEIRFNYNSQKSRFGL